MNKEKALELINELLELEEINDIGNLTRRERAELQSLVRETFEEKEADHIAVDTPEGKLEARISEAPDNPGLYIELHPKDVDYPIDMALVKYDSETDSVKLFTWGDAMREDYTYEAGLKNLSRLRESEKEYE